MSIFLQIILLENNQQLLTNISVHPVLSEVMMNYGECVSKLIILCLHETGEGLQKPKPQFSGIISFGPIQIM